ncbi:MAG: site-specific integrase [Bacteroidota bacterium]
MKEMARRKKYTVVPNLDTSSPAIEHEGRCPFRINVRINGKVKPYLTGFAHMDRKYWVPEKKADGTNSKKMRIVHAQGNKNSKALARKIAAKEILVLKVLEEMEIKKDPITHAILANKLQGTQAQTLIEFCEWRKKEESADVAKGTIAIWDSNIKSLRMFDEDVMLKEVNDKWLKRYEEYLRRDHPVYAGREGKDGTRKIKCYGLKDNSIVSKFWYLGKIFSYAVDECYIPANPMRRFKHDKKVNRRLRYNRPDRQTLEQDEINMLHWVYRSGELKNYTQTSANGRTLRPGKKYHNILQQILASIYTGFRFGDISQFQDDLLVTISGNRISLVMQKVQRRHTIRITDSLREILNLDGDGGSLFNAPIYTNDAMNNNLRRIMAILGIKKYLSWHDLRRTFATILQEKDVDIYKVSKLMGHKSVVVTEKYVQVKDKCLDKAIGVLDQLGENPLPERAALFAMIKEIVHLNPRAVLPSNVIELLEGSATRKAKEGKVIPVFLDRMVA